MACWHSTVCGWLTSSCLAWCTISHGQYQKQASLPLPLLLWKIGVMHDPKAPPPEWLTKTADSLQQGNAAPLITSSRVTVSADAAQLPQRITQPALAGPETVQTQPSREHTLQGKHVAARLKALAAALTFNGVAASNSAPRRHMAADAVHADDDLYDPEQVAESFTANRYAPAAVAAERCSAPTIARVGGQAINTAASVDAGATSQSGDKPPATADGVPRRNTCQNQTERRPL